MEAGSKKSRSRAAGLVLSLVLAGAACAHAQAAAPKIRRCQELAQWLGRSFPPQGTLLCPDDAAWGAFARDAGFASWPALMAAAREQPEAWKRALGRLLDYHHSSSRVPAASITTGTTVPTSLRGALVAGNASWHSGGGAGAEAPNEAMTLMRAGAGYAAVFVQRRGGAKRAETVRLPVVAADAMVLPAGDAGDGGVVHVVSRIALPADTHPSLLRAVKRTRELAFMARWGLRELRTLAKRRAPLTLLMPTDGAWRALDAAARAKEGWARGVRRSNVARAPQLLDRLTLYYAIPLSAALPAPLTADALTGACRLASPAQGAGRPVRPLTMPPLLLPRGAYTMLGWGPANFLEAPSLLTVRGRPQSHLITCNAASGAVYVIGGRNQLTAPYMAAAQLRARTIYAGASTVLLLDGPPPLPLLTGRARFDKRSNETALDW